MVAADGVATEGAMAMARPTAGSPVIVPDIHSLEELVERVAASTVKVRSRRAGNGSGSIVGAVLGSFLLTLLPEAQSFVRFLPRSAYLAVYGAAIMLTEAQNIYASSLTIIVQHADRLLIDIYCLTRPAVYIALQPTPLQTLLCGAFHGAFFQWPEWR